MSLKRRLRSCKLQLERLDDRALPSAGFRTITDPDPRYDHEFGGVMTAYGAWLAISDPGDSYDGVFQAGSVRIFDQATGAVRLTIRNPEPGTIDQFGSTLATFGDKLLIGSDSDNSLAGSAYVFDWSTGQELYQLQNPRPFAPNRFGFSFAALGDDIVVSARGEEYQRGAVYLFDGPTGALIRTFEDPGQTINGHFGWAVEPFGDDLLVSAPFENAPTYLIDVATGATILTMTNPEPGHAIFFGDSLATIDGKILIGAPGNESPGNVYVFDGMTGQLLSTVRNPETDALALAFGADLTVFGSNVLVTAPLSGPGGIEQTGVAYVFDGNTWELKQTISNPEPSPGDWFGFSPVISGNTLFVSALKDNAGGIFAAGTVYVLPLDFTPPILTATATPPALWPPNGKMVTVRVTGRITDEFSGFNPATATYATVDSYGEVQPSGSFTVNDDGTFSFGIQLQSRRNGKDKACRTYTITLNIQDLAGNWGRITLTVVVPHDQRS